MPMNTDYDSDVEVDDEGFEIDPALTASLGFSSFGVQKPKPKPTVDDAESSNAKRRKYTHLDAVIAEPERTVRKNASGGNAAPLGERRRKGDGNEEVGMAVRGVEATDSASGELALPLQVSQEEVQNQDLTVEAQHTEAPTSSSYAANELNRAPKTGSSLSNNFKNGAASMDIDMKNVLSQQDLQALRSGLRLENGDLAYFLPSFVEDPWARLMAGRTQECLVDKGEHDEFDA